MAESTDFTGYRESSTLLPINWRSGIFWGPLPIEFPRVFRSNSPSKDPSIDSRVLIGAGCTYLCWLMCTTSNGLIPLLLATPLNRAERHRHGLPTDRPNHRHIGHMHISSLLAHCDPSWSGSSESVGGITITVDYYYFGRIASSYAPCAVAIEFVSLLSHQTLFNHGHRVASTIYFHRTVQDVTCGDYIYNFDAFI